MAQVSYPGVYIVEKASGVRTITGVATSIAAFVGYTRKGVPDRAVAITSFADFERSYGGLDRGSPVSYAVRQFFMNGGTQALIVRVAINHATAAWVLQDSALGDVLDVEAASPGAWGNGLRLTVQHTGVRNPDTDFNLVVSQLQPDDNLLVPVETHRNLSLDSNSAQYVESVINNASALVRVTRSAGVVFAEAGRAVSTAIAFPLAPSNTTIGGTLDGTTSFLLTLEGAPWASIGDLVTAADDAIVAAGLGAQLQASETGADGGGGNDHLTLESTTAGETSSVVIAGGSFGGLSATIHIGLANGGREFTGAAEHRPAAVSDVVPATPGADGSRGGALDLLGLELPKTGIYALRDVDLFNLLLIPETFDMTSGQEAGLIPAAISLCVEKRAFYVVDAPSNRTLTNPPGPSIGDWVQSTLGGLGNAARNAATYFPPVRIVDPLDGLRPRAMAPSGTLAGIYARTDAQRGVWKAPAGTDATLNGVLDVALPINDIENGQLNPLGVNVIRSFPAYGRVSWGARTGRGADAHADEYKYISIRRLALFIEESLYRGTQWVVFEPNDEPLWAQIRLNLGAFMNGLFRQGAFQGKTPQEAFFVKCDKETTTQADRNLGIVNIQVGFAPLKPAEFVVITIQQIAGDLQ